MLLHVSMCLYAMFCFIGLDSFLLFSDLLFQSLGFACTKGLNLSTDSHMLVLFAGKSTSNKHICWCSHSQSLPLDPSSSFEDPPALPQRSKDFRGSFPKDFFCMRPIPCHWLHRGDSSQPQVTSIHVFPSFLYRNFSHLHGPVSPPLPTPCAFEAHQMLYWCCEGERFFSPSLWILFLSSQACCIKAHELVTTGQERSSHPHQLDSASVLLAPWGADWELLLLLELLVKQTSWNSKCTGWNRSHIYP